MRAHGVGVTAGNRPGQPRVAQPQPVVQRRAQQRAEQPLRLPNAGSAEQVGGLGDQRDQVVRAGRQRRVVERPELVRDRDRLAADLQHQRLGDRQHRLRSGHPESHSVDLVHVFGSPDERHRRMQRHRQCPGPRGRRQHTKPMRPGRVRDQPARLPPTSLGQPGHQPREHVVRDRQQREIHVGDHFRDRQQRYARQELFGSPLGRVRDSGGRDHVVAHSHQRRAQRHSDAAGSDDADPQMARRFSHGVIQSVRSGYRSGRQYARAVADRNTHSYVRRVTTRSRTRPLFRERRRSDLCGEGGDQVSGGSGPLHEGQVTGLLDGRDSEPRPPARTP